MFKAYKAYRLKVDLHRFDLEWMLACQVDNRLGINYLYDSIRRSVWYPKIRALPEEERVTILRDAFVTDPPDHPKHIKLFNRNVQPSPIMVFWLGTVCLDSTEILEDLFTTALRDRPDGRWAYTAVRPLGAIRTIDLVFETYQDLDDLEFFLYDFELEFLPEVDPQDRRAVKHHYKKCRIASREKQLPFSSVEEREEYAKRLDAVLDWRLELEKKHRTNNSSN